MASSGRAMEVSQDSRADSGAHGSPYDEPADTDAAVVSRRAETGSLRDNESLLATGTRGDALVRSPPCELCFGGCYHRGWRRERERWCGG